MANLELGEDTKKGTETPVTADLLIAIVTPVNVEELRVTAAETILRMSPQNVAEADPSLSGLRAAIAFPGIDAEDPESSNTTVHLDPAGSGVEIHFVPLPVSNSPSAIPWLGSSTAYQAVFSLGREMGVRACAVIASDLAALRPDALQSLLAPVRGSRCDLCMPVYPIGKYEGLLNSSILAPLPRALYGKRVSFPLAPDFGFSSRLLPTLGQPARQIAQQGKTLFWPATEAAVRGHEICQTHLNVRHVPGDGLDLSTVIAQTVGPLFAEMEGHAALWQRVRGSQPVETTGVPLPLAVEDSNVDVSPMLETFALGFRNLQEMWALALPPVTLLELKRLSRMGADQFRMPDQLWVRIVYDFALAYRLRTLSRTHLLGALTPLYLGWAASHVLEVSKMRARDAEQRVERLARVYEDEKPYLLSRWRWPDRFNP